MLLEKERKEIVEYGKELIRQHLTSGTGGNISIYNREEDLMAISPSGIGYFETEPEDVVVMKLDGTVVDGNRKPSSEFDLHVALYREKPEITAVVHTHSMFCTVFSCLNRPLEAVHYILADAQVDTVPVAPYVTYGTKELAEAVQNTIGESHACLMANHGMITCGRTLKSAFSLARECEWIAELQWRCLCVGTPNILPSEEMKVVLDKFRNYGQVKGTNH